MLCFNLIPGVTLLSHKFPLADTVMLPGIYRQKPLEKVGIYEIKS